MSKVKTVNEPKTNWNWDAERREIRSRIDLYHQLQKMRIATENRQHAFLSGADESGRKDKGMTIHKLILEPIRTLEKRVEKSVHVWVEKRTPICPILAELSTVKGIGKMYAAYLVAYIDIAKADTVSALWRFAGYGVVDGKAERPVKGQTIHYSQRLKDTCWKIGMSFLKCKSPYADVYYERRKYYATTHPEWTPIHQHKAALRAMVKLFLAHLWIRWRTLEGLPVRPPYVHEKLQHSTYRTPEEFGWGEH